jgi:hypothetical protein
MSPRMARRLIQMTRESLPNEAQGEAVWLVVHYTYSDGSEEYEVRSLSGEFPPQRFWLRSEMQSWLRRRGCRVI